MMIVNNKIIILALCLYSGILDAFDPFGISNHLREVRNVYGIDCIEVNLISWRHPTRKIMDAYANGLTLRWLALCKNNTYPVFGVDLVYDPRLNATNSFYVPLFNELFDANFKWPYTLWSDDFVIEIEKAEIGVKTKILEIDSE